MFGLHKKFFHRSGYKGDVTTVGASGNTSVGRERGEGQKDEK